ncbi:MAG TPA: magnesium transporter [Candidatus Dependentiae bacterium]|nr:magnesium transporter [Candidatus Dependentiae bacterium]HRQ62912.1 magnesium transporter [Candidatus Dependentiae bacterium]
MERNNIINEIRENLIAVIEQSSPLGISLWQALVEMHPVDIVDFLSAIDRDYAEQIFKKLPEKLSLEVFSGLSDSMKVFILSRLDDHERVDLLNELPTDELTDLFDELSDEELKHYLNLLHKREREKVLSLLKFDADSAGGIMDIDVVTLTEDFTVAKSIQLLQRLQPSKEIHHNIYVTDRTHRLVGYINLEDLVLQKPTERISSFMQDPELVVHADEDQEKVAKAMVRYDVMTVPVVDEANRFLGSIPTSTLVDVLVEEAAEDVEKMSALAPMRHSYFETPFFQQLWERSYILIALLLAESFSGVILRSYEATLGYLLLAFVPTLISTGGNTSTQTSAIVMRGMGSGEILGANVWRFLRREFMMAVMLAIILGTTAFIRLTVISQATMLQGIAVSTSLGLLVMLSISLGSSIPFILRRFNIDPAFSAGPFLSTLMDILGVLIYCYIAKLIMVQ